MRRAALPPLLAVLVTLGAPAARPAQWIAVGGTPLQIVGGRGALWVLTCDRGCSGEARQSVGRLVRIDALRGRVTASTAVQHPGAFAVGAGGIYVTDFESDTVRRIDSRTLRLAAVLKLRLPFRFAPGAPGGNDFLPIDVAAGSRGVWIATERCAVAHADLRASRVISTVRMPCDAFGGLAIGRDAVWVGEDLAGVYRVDPLTNRVVARVRLGPRAARLGTIRLFAAGDTILVVGDRTRAGVATDRNGLARIDANTNRVEGITSLPSGPLAVTFGNGSLWVARAGGSQVERVDPRTGELLGHLYGRVGVGLAVVRSRVWTITRAGSVRALGA
jgi:DNA-binding beta-propeller fold protein YncE